MENLFEPLFSNPLAGLELIAKLTLVLLLGLLTCLCLPKASAATRRVIWSFSLLFALALPLLTNVLPAVSLIQSGQALPPAGLPNSPVTESLPLLPATEAQGPMAASNSQAAPVGALPPTDAKNVDFAPLAITAALLLWLAGAMVFAGKIASASLRAYRLRCRAHGLGADQLLPAQLPSNTAIYLSDEVTTPVAVGVFKPAILLPVDSCQWSEEKRRAAILHELAHIQHGDNRLRLLALIACCLYWFHPLVWFAARKLREEQEKCADDFVLRQGVNPSSYAQSLLDIVNSLRGEQQNAVLVSMAGYSDFPQRMRSILSTSQARSGLSRAGSTMLTIAMASVFLPLALLTFQASPVVAQTNADSVSVDEDAKVFHDMYADIAAGYSAGDPEQITRYYANDIQWTTPDKTLEGKAAVQAELKELDINGLTFETRLNSVRIDGDKAVVSGSRSAGLPRMNGRFIDRAFTTHWERRNGQWLATRERLEEVQIPGLANLDEVIASALEPLENMDFDWDGDFNINFGGHDELDTPLHGAVRSGNPEVVEVLLERGAKVNARNKREETPLQLAVKVANPRVVELLLEANADVEAADRRGRTPIYLASQHGHSEIVELLLEAGAKVN